MTGTMTSIQQSQVQSTSYKPVTAALQLCAPHAEHNWSVTVAFFIRSRPLASSLWLESNQTLLKATQISVNKRIYPFFRRSIEVVCSPVVISFSLGHPPPIGEMRIYAKLSDFIRIYANLSGLSCPALPISIPWRLRFGASPAWR